MEEKRRIEKGLPIAGLEHPGQEYKIGEKIDFGKPFERQSTPLATGAIDPDFTIEGLVVPLIRPIGWGLVMSGLIM